MTDLKQPWSDSEVNMLLSYGRSYLRERTGLEINWDRNNIRRLRDYEVIGNEDGKRHMILPNIENQAAAQHLINSIWLESPNTYALIFVTGINFRQQVNGYTEGLEGHTGWLGSLITRRGLRHQPELVVAHELVHGFGRVTDRLCAGAAGYLMSKGPCGFGPKLTPGEVTAVPTNSFRWR